MLLQTSILTFVAIIGPAHSQNLNSPESLGFNEDEDIKYYRPWEHDNTSTTWISLSGMGIATIKDVLRVNVPNLEWLVLDNNQINTIPAETFKFLSDLTYISLTENQISQIETGAFSYLEKLQVIDLDGNGIGDNLDSRVFDVLPELKHLYLRNCQLSSFYLPENVDNLSHLYLSGNQISSFEAVSDSALTHLYLNNNNLNCISLSHLRSLIYLDLSSNRFHRIKFLSSSNPGYYVTRYGRRAYYCDNYNSGLSLEFASSLRYLIASSNEISEIASDAFLRTKALVHIDLSGNKISEVYAGTFNSLPYLENILLDSNDIKAVNYRTFVDLPSLKILSLKNNRITDIDEDAFTKLESYANEVYLYLENNQIHTLRNNSFANIKGLKYIGLSYNRIKVISSHAFVNLPNLESVVIENQLPDETSDSDPWDSVRQVSLPRRSLIASHAFFNLSSIKFIRIRGNVYSDIQAKAFDELPKLKLLDLSKNNIETLSSEAFRELPVVENLNLRGNLISKIAPQTFPRHLKHLDLGLNRVCPEFSCWHVDELYQLEKLDVSDIIEEFKIEDLAGLPKNLTVVVRKATAPLDSPISDTQ